MSEQTDIVIINAAAITPSQGILRDVSLCIKNGSISDISKGRVSAPVESAAMIIDAAGLYLSPGFVDIHLHGGGGHDFMDGTQEAFAGAARAHAEHGTTSMLPTTVTCPDEELEKTFRVFTDHREKVSNCFYEAADASADAAAANASGSSGFSGSSDAEIADSPGAIMPGLHLEGPYFSPAQAGAQDPAYIRIPERGHYMNILNRYAHLISRWSIAPELPGALELGEELDKRGILVSTGHTDACYEQIEEAYNHGYRLLTHFYSGMSGVRRIKGIRRAGAIESAYIDDRLIVEIIADGMHLPAPLLQMIYKNIGADRIILITDAMRAAGTDAEKSVIGSIRNGQEVVIKDGVAWMPGMECFAGSIATMDRLVRNMVRLAGATLPEAIRMASCNPARITGMDGKGSLEKGKDADLIIFNEDINVQMTIIGGKVIFRRGI
ncbi:MAG: N-acetylglucosamine-6-phosphate deacetylase [Eubacteriales bacterium]|nr:N-acetylglucosamine-6-phosphate deacetylase [Eubacteriales bacterium]